MNYLGIDNLHNLDPYYKVNFQKVWMFMSYFMLRMEGKKIDEIKSKNSKFLRYYQNNLLGSSGSEGKTLLTELYPIPCASVKSWPDRKKKESEKLFPDFKNKEEYQEYVFPQRKKLFLEFLNSAEFDANIIICYGKTKWGKYKDFFSDLVHNWNCMNLSKPACEGLMDGNIKIFLIPFLGNGQVSYKFIDELVDYINREN